MTLLDIEDKEIFCKLNGRMTFKCGKKTRGFRDN